MEFGSKITSLPKLPFFTLEQFLDDEFTPEVKATSAAVFETVTQKMARAANKLGDVLSLEDVSSFKREIVH